MADRPTITTVAAGAKYDPDTLNGNFQALRDAFDTVIGLSGTGGSNNTATGDIDLGGKTLRNATFSGTVVGVDWKGAWATSTAYVVNDLVFVTNTTYICVVAHTSGTFSPDLAAAKWETFASGSGSFLVATNNLSDVTTAATARSNLSAQENVVTTRGDIVYTNASPAAARLAVGTANQVVATNGTDVAWATLAAAHLPAASTTAIGAVELATQAEMETGTSAAVLSSVGNMYFHPLMPKAWIRFTDTSSSTPTISESYNCTSISRTSTGVYVVTWSIAMSTTTYGVLVTALHSSQARAMGKSQTTTTTTVQCTGGAETAVDPDAITIVIWGDI